MRRYVLVFLLALACVSAAQAYILNIDVPSQVQAGAPLIVTGSSTFPAGTGFDVVLSRSQYTSDEVARRSTAIGSDGLFTATFDTIGLDGGQYKVEARLNGIDASKLGTSSSTVKIVQIIDRSKELTITSPLLQSMPDALLIAGSLDKAGNGGVQIQVSGPSGNVFGPQYIATQATMGQNLGRFSKQVSVTEPGNYFVTLYDSRGYIARVTFQVTGTAATPVVTIPETPVITETQTPAQPASPVAPVAKSPLPVILFAGSLLIAGLFAIRRK
jgi:hypothetical protein